MTDEDTHMHELGRAYRQVKAPGHLASRILAEAEERTSRRRGYGLLPLAAAAAVAALVVVIPYLTMQERVESYSVRPAHIPLSRVQGHMPTISSFHTPNLADIQGLPALPSRHDMAGLEAEEQPQTHLPADGEPSLT